MKSDINWNQICHSGLTLGALAIAEDEPDLAAKIVSRAVECLPFALKSYAPDGAYPEGPGYWGYGTIYNVLFLSAVETALGSDFGLSRSPGFLASADYEVRALGPTGLYHNYSDCAEKAELNAALFWFSARRNEPSLLHLQMEKLAEATSPSTDPARSRGKSLPFVLLWAGPKLAAEAPKALDWIGQGRIPVAFFRSGWDEQSLFVGIKAGTPSVSHAHMDAGSFVFDALGVRWVKDLGSQEYNGLEQRGISLFNNEQGSGRWTVFRLNNLGHSTLTFNGALQNVAGQASLTTSDLGSSSPKATVDCSSIYAGQAAKMIRTFTFSRRKSLQILDLIEAVSKPGVVRWQVVTKASIKIQGADAILQQDGKTLLVRRLSPAGSWKVEDISKPPRDFDAPNPGTNILVLEVPVLAGDSPRIEVELTPHAGGL